MRFLKPFDDSGQFPLSRDGLRGQAIRGAAATILSSGLGLGIQMIATVVLARLLVPEDFGLVAMVTTFSLLVSNLGYNGFTEGILQREDVTHRLASNVFWLNLGLGSILTVGFALFGPVLAWLYDNPRIEAVTTVVSLTILLSSSWVLHSALLKRAMRFSALSAIDVVARVTSVAVSIGLGAAGWGHWALVGGLLSIPLVTSAGVWTLCRWVPGRPRLDAETASFARFAIQVYGRFLVNYGSRNMDYLLVGVYFSAQSLGFYKKAYDLFALSSGQVVGPVTHVAVSALSRLRQAPQKYKLHLFGALETIAFVGMGVGALVTVSGRDVVRLVLGPQWEPAAPIFALFGPGIGIMQLYATHGWIHLSLGRADRWFRWGIVELGITASLFLLLLDRGPAGIALAWTLSLWILTLPGLWYAGRPIRLEVMPIVGVVWRFVAASLAAGYGSVALLSELQAQQSFLAGSSATAALTRLLLICPMFGGLYLGMVILLHGGGEPLYKLLRLTREMLPGQPATKSPSAVAVETSV